MGNIFSACAIQKICIFCEGFGSESILFLTSLFMKHCTYIKVRPHVYVKILIFFDGLYCVGFINLVGAAASVRGQRIGLSIGLIRVTETECSLIKVALLNKRWKDG
jgi:hypothetical protein